MRCGTENPSQVKEVGRESEKASVRARGHKAAATTAGMTLAASVSSHEDDGNSAKARRMSVTPQEPQPASRMVTNTTADAVNPNMMSAEPTRPADEPYNPLDKAQSILLERWRTGASDELSAEVPVNETTTTQLTWTPWVERPSGEVHEVAESHKEVAGGEVEGGAVDEWACTTNDKSRPSKDPGDMTGDGKRHPDEPTELPNQPKGTRWQGIGRGEAQRRH